MIWPIAGRGRPRKRYIPDILSMSAEDMLANARWRAISWRAGRKESSSLVLLQSACGLPTDRRSGSGTRVSAWLIGEHRISGEKKYYLANLPAKMDLRTLASIINETMDLRAGSPATERRTRSRSLRGPILARTASSRAHDDDRLRFPPVSPAQNRKAEKKKSTGRRLSQPCPPCVRPSSNSLLDHRRSDVPTAENGFATRYSVNKICQSSAKASNRT